MQIVVIGGSDAGIAAARRARALDSQVRITVLLADAYPDFSIGRACRTCRRSKPVQL